MLVGSPDAAGDGYGEQRSASDASEEGRFRHGLIDPKE